MFKPNLYQAPLLTTLAAMLLFTLLTSTSQGALDPAPEPQEIGENVFCGKCGMRPAQYPQWQTQVVFADGMMTPFDGCKCMFGFLLDMDRFDQAHTAGDVAAVWVRAFNSGDWIDAKKAHYVIGSDEMGPMGKELIPFTDASAADNFSQKHGGRVARYDTIDMKTLQSIMGKMSMKNKMKM